MPPWKSRAQRFLRNRSRKLDKQNRGWRGLVFNRAFVAMILLFAMWLYEEPWAAVWIGSVIIGGVVVAVFIRATHSE
jgi:hypothetical protein